MTKPCSCFTALALFFCFPVAFAQEHADTGTVPGAASQAPPAPQETAAGDGETCLHCTESEQLVVDLNYIKQITDILKDINENYRDIDDSSAESIQDMVGRINPELVNVVLRPGGRDAAQDVEENDSPGPPALGLPAQDDQIDRLQEEIRMLKQELAMMRADTRPAAIAQSRDDAEQQQDRPEPGSLEGLVLKHVNLENLVTGARARVVVHSHRETLDLTLDSAFTHNDTDYIVRAIEKQGGGSPERRHLVFIENTGTGEVHPVPW